MAESGTPIVVAAPLVLVLPDGERLPIADTMTIGRGEDATVVLDDRSVSRLHARITSGPSGPMIEDAGSRYGVIVAGQPLLTPRLLFPGTEIQLGNVLLRVDSATGPAIASFGASESDPAPDPNATIVVPIGSTQADLRSAAPAGDGGIRPRVRSGWALKRLDDGSGETRYVLRDLRGGSFLKLDTEDAQLFQLIDGKHTISELLAEATSTLGAAGPGRLARLLADLGERGLLEGIAPTPKAEPEPGVLARAFAPKERVFEGAGDYFERAYRHWGWIFFSPLVVTGLVLLSLAGLSVFSYLVGARYHTPLVDVHRLVIGGAVFIAGRFAIVGLHEIAHGLALRHYGRNTSRAGLRLIFIFPYAFVDSSEAYFEPRMHRIAISAAGPVSDFSVGALFSILCAVSPRGNVRDVFFTLALAAYVGAFFNVNPFLERDGYQILSEWLREPRLRARARAQLKERLSGRISGEQSSPVLLRYGAAGLVWSLIGAGFMLVLSLRYYSELSKLAPHAVVLGGFIGFFALILLPIPLALVAPALHRARYGTPEVNRVVR